MVYTAYPDVEDEGPHDDVVLQTIEEREAERKAREQKKILTSMRAFIARHPAEDLANLSVRGEPTEYKGRGKAIKKKGGKPPAVFSLVETYVDFQKAVKDENFEAAISLFYYLKHFLD